MKSKNNNPFRLLTVSLALPAIFSTTVHAASQTWDGEATTNVLNTATNWTNNALPTSALDTATWDGTVTGPLSLVWNAAFGPGSGNAGGVSISLAATQTDSVQLDATAGTFGLGDVTIATGAGALTLGNGVGTATMTMRDPSMMFSNDSTNTATIKSDVVFGNGGGGGSRPIIVTGSGNWLFECAVIPSGFSTSAILTKSGNGTLTLAAQSFQNSTTAINGGAILITNGAALGTGPVTLGAGTAAKLQVANGITLTNAINTNGSTASTTNGAIENSSGDNILNSNITWNQTGGSFTNIASVSGTLTLNGTFTPSGGITGNRTLNLTGTGTIISSATNTISNGTAILGLRKSGAGTATVMGTNGYTGPTTLAGGTLSLGSAGAIASLGAIEFIGGTLQHSATNTTDYSARIAAGASTSAVSIDTNGQNITFATPLTGSQSGGLTKNGSGTLTLATANAHTGTTTVKTGVLAVQNAGALSTGNVLIEGGGGIKQLELSGDIVLDGPTNIDIAGRFSVPSDDPANAALVNASGDNAISSSVRFGATGGTWINIRSNSGTLTLGGDVTASVSSSRNINFTGAGDITIDGVISNGSATPIGISKGGTGTLTLTDTNTYTGDTSVRAGSLVLASTGSINDSTSLGISAGATLDTTAKAGFTLPATVTFGLDGTSATSGRIDAFGKQLDIDGATVTFSITGSLTAPAYVLAEYSSIIGTPSFSSVTPPTGYSMDYTYSGGTQIALVQSIADPFDPWITSFFGSESNPAVIGKNADPDGDGASNLLEFALKGDPTSGSNNGLQASLIQDASSPVGNELTLIIAVREGASFSPSGNPAVQTATKDGMVYAIQGSLDLLTLPGSAVSHVSGPADTAPPSAGLPELTGTDWKYHTFKLDTSEGLSGKGFLRARVEPEP
jgi:autotransporter-associated beta strand protein